MVEVVDGDAVCTGWLRKLDVIVVTVDLKLIH